MSTHDDFVKKLQIFALATDPIYIGTGGYNIGRVDNTIVRDPITNVPKIPGSSLAGVWRYYLVLEALERFKEEIQSKFDSILDSLGLSNDKKQFLKETKLRYAGFNELRNSICEVLKIEKKSEECINLSKELAEALKSHVFNSNENNPNGNDSNEDNSKWELFSGNRFLQITCAGQDNVPQKELEEAPYTTNKEGKTGHCGHCIVCKGFGFSKRDISWQGMLFFSDLQILFFPVFTIKGTKWITTRRIIEGIDFSSNQNPKSGNGSTDNNKNKETENNSQKERKLYFVNENLPKEEGKGYINLGWLYLPYTFISDEFLIGKIEKIVDNLPYKVNLEDIIIVSEDLFSHIVNSNLEVRTSVSIDPITGAAKEGALFTSEAIPRGTIFYGEIRIFDKSAFANLEPKLKPLPDSSELEGALEDSKRYFESLGIGGMTTRGFGRLKIEISQVKGNKKED